MSASETFSNQMCRPCVVAFPLAMCCTHRTSSGDLGSAYGSQELRLDCTPRSSDPSVSCSRSAASRRWGRWDPTGGWDPAGGWTPRVGGIPRLAGNRPTQPYAAIGSQAGRWPDMIRDHPGGNARPRSDAVASAPRTAVRPVLPVEPGVLWQSS